MTNGHIVVDVVTLRLSERLRALLALVTNALALGFLAVMVWRLWLRADFLLLKGDTTPVWGIPLWPVAFAMAFGSVFFLTGVCLHLIDACRRVMGRQRHAAAAAGGAALQRISPGTVCDPWIPRCFRS